MRTTLLIVSLAIFISSCGLKSNIDEGPKEEMQKIAVDSLMNQWHRAAANADLSAYIGAMDQESIYIGTDASENWTKDKFESFCKPYFKKKTTWDFTPLQRNIFLDENTAWFDELLKTQMGICRGSGVLVKTDNEWKIKHYVLSMTIPNDNSKEIIDIKKDYDIGYINLLINSSEPIN